MSTSVSSVTNHFPSAENGFTTTTSGSVSSGATTVGLNSVAGYANGEIAVFVIDPSDASKKQTFTGTIDTSGVQVTDVVWTAGTNQTHSAGATVVDYATATHISMITKGLLVEHTQAGRHVMTSPKVITDISDTNGNELLKVTATGSAVNELTLANAATGNAPSISATGGDTNIGLKLIPKGTGAATIGSNSIMTELGYAAITANLSNLTSATYSDLTGLTVTVTVPATGKVRIHGHFGQTISSISSILGVRIQEDTTVLQQCTYYAGGTSITGAAVDIFVELTGVSAGSHTYKLTGANASAAGNITPTAAATAPGFIKVDGIGG